MPRIAVVDRNKCNPLACGNYLCIRVCPVNKMGEECIVEGEYKKAKIIDELCNGCGICPKKCPFGAIQIINIPEKLATNPMHRYGQNMFELFSLPIVKPKTIVGIIGRNGIGKSTALQILTGKIEPNLGRYKDPPLMQEIILNYSTQWLGGYLKGLLMKEMKVSYKPQRVEFLAELYKGQKVKELLEKVDERKVIPELMKELDLTDLQERTIDELSGGELQRLAIAAACAKKASVYYFDEPTSFCDITHRIKVAKLIRSLAEKEGVSVIVVEHDLATLDYISDEIQIVFGEPGAYGIFSQSKAVRRGINEYLDGYLPDDNMRFREYPIKFSAAPEDKIVSKQILVEYPELKKEFESFKLNVDAGQVHRGEVLAVMGSNGLGKSTMMKMLAGLIKPDNVDIEKIAIAFKPQYLEQNMEGTVGDYLRKIAGSEFSSGWYKTNILEKLNIRSILNNQIKHLSGGELQKMHIAATLSTPDIILVAMDEPSAFIDVEDRLKVAEVIKEFISKKEICAIVVDHDIQFIDYLADSMLVFEGNPGKEGFVLSPLSKRAGMNKVLKNLDITYRRDKENGRPRINKPGSQLDQEQRRKGEYYYS
ncbi:MAG: ribosome biogenesis/translation initiation ATPase RLI [Candidatus Nanoarchaeia archaeon]